MRSTNWLTERWSMSASCLKRRAVASRKRTGMVKVLASFHGPSVDAQASIYFLIGPQSLNHSPVTRYLAKRRWSLRSSSRPPGIAAITGPLNLLIRSTGHCECPMSGIHHRIARYNLSIERSLTLRFLVFIGLDEFLSVRWRSFLASCFAPLAVIYDDLHCAMDI